MATEGRLTEAAAVIVQVPNELLSKKRGKEEQGEAYTERMSGKQSTARRQKTQAPPKKLRGRGGYKKSPAATYFPTLDEQYHRRNESLTSVFGMETGIASPLWLPGNKKRSKGI